MITGKRWFSNNLGLFMLCAAAVAYGSSEPVVNRCSTVESLLLDTDFALLGTEKSPWSYSQHAGEASFSFQASDGELEIRRVDKEPWTLLTQTVSHSTIDGLTVRFSAELKANAPAQPPIHGFAHVVGLYLKVGNRRDASLADHQPNSGIWDWQTISVEKAMPQGATTLRLGFVHQSGGALWVRNPKLTLLECLAEKDR